MTTNQNLTADSDALLSKETIELLFQRIIQSAGLKECQVKGEGRNGAFVLANILVCQVCLLVEHRAASLPLVSKSI